jgi:TonB-linked SusC/RagA family outer membrane protein
MKLNHIVTTLILLTIFQCSFGQSGGDIIIKGTVSSATTGESLIGAAVAEVNAENRVISGTTTDINGQYVIRIKNRNNQLSFSYVGFKKLLSAIGRNNTVNIALEDESKQLEEVTITAQSMHSDGTFSIPQREISGAVQKVSTKEFEGVQVTSIDDALQGRIAGLDIVSNSGDPGSGTTMRIRGASSINANTQPLIVINGVPWETEVDANFDFANADQEQYATLLTINPEDIIDIAVLKDAASTAIWGSKGANGVLNITTKKGTAGPTKLNYAYGFTRSVQPKGINMLNGGDYTMMMKQALFNPQQSDVAANVDEYNYKPAFSEYENYNNNTDWVKEVTQTGMINDHYLTASGGGERARYRISGGYFKQQGTVIGQELSRITSRANLDYSVSDRLKFTSEFSFTYSDNQRNYTYVDDDNNKYSILAIAYKKMPNISVYSQDLYGNNTGTYYNILSDSRIGKSQRDLPNPVALARLAKDEVKNYRITPVFRVQYDLLDPKTKMLRYNMYISFDVDNSKNAVRLPLEAWNRVYTDEKANRVENSDVENLTIQTDNNLTWNPKFSSSNHNLLFYGSFQTRSGRSSPLGITSFGYPSSQFGDASSEANLLSTGSRTGRWRSMAVLGGAHYSFKSKYIFHATLRTDGSTKFGKDRKYGTFPGVSAKWIISDESFIKHSQKWLSMLAIRPSWGISGNQPSAEYLSFSRYATNGSYIDMSSVIPSSLPLSSLRWEKSTSYNFGMDLGFFNDKIVMDLNAYSTRTEDMLFKDVELPSSSGYSKLPWANVGTMGNKGWEINVNGNKLVSVGKFSFSLNFNLANNRNTLIKLDPRILDNYNVDYNYTNGTYLSRLQENNSYGSIYGFKYKGVYRYNDYVAGIQEQAPVARDAAGKVITDNNGVPLPMKFGYGQSVVDNGNGYTFKGGDAIYEDINHDGNIDELDIVYLGNSNPKLNGGFSPSIRYKNFTLTTFFNFRIGNKIVNVARMNLENMYSYDNQSIAVNYRWRKDGDVTDMPRALNSAGYNWLGSDRYVEDGTFLRFKSLTVWYEFPKKVLSKIMLSNLKIYLNINNVAVFSKYTGVDPEVGYGSFGVSTDGNKTPRTKDMTLRVSVDF